jgi:L-ascorbate 6-phosphate lactonase
MSWLEQIKIPSSRILFMANFELKTLRETRPDKNQLVIYWLGGAGFVFQFADAVVCIDPYLSDYCERTLGEDFRRLTVPPVSPKNLSFDFLLISHDHPDHLDVDGFDAMMRVNPAAAVLASDSCREFLESRRISHRIVSPGMVQNIGAESVRVVRANHGDLCPTAVGFLISFSGRSLYFAGDTCYDESLVAEISRFKPDIVIPCINGAYGNMNEEEAAVVAGRCEARYTIPMHFGLFFGHGGCPRRFAESLKKHAPRTRAIALTPGRGVIL